jgi:manganese/iron transport system ATP-binding protein
VAQTPDRRPHHIHTAPAIEAQGISVFFDKTNALRNVSFVLPRGEHLAVVGPNGAGKTTLFHTISGILRPESGRVDIYGHPPGGHVCIAYVPQRSRVDWSFPATVLEVVMMGRIREIGLFRWPRKADWEFAREALQRVGLNDLVEKQIGELSGGQQQRVFLAQALAQEAELILLDEPLSGLDFPSREAIFEILDELKREHVTVAIATHDLDLAAQQFDRVMLLNHDLISYGSPEEALTTSSLMNAFGGHLHQFGENGGLVVFSDECEDPENTPA